MKDIDQYSTLNELTRDLEADSSRRVPLKVMGKERSPDTNMRDVYDSDESHDI